MITREPVRLYSIVVAILAIVAHYVPDIPTPLYLGLVAAVLGVGGEATRARVTPYDPKAPEDRPWHSAPSNTR